jgi:hypothetical protein
MATENKAIDETNLSEVWDALVNAGATVYEWLDNGVSFGAQVIRVGSKHMITVDDVNGYMMIDFDEDEIDLAPTADHDAAAILAASDTDGWFGIVGVPGSNHHAFEWFESKEDADAWVEEVGDGFLPSRVITAREAFDAKWQDGNRIYFQLNVCGGPGYEPKR